MKIISRQTALIILAILISGTLFAAEGEFPAEDEWFTFAVEQNGRPVPIERNKVILEKAPFTLVPITRGPMGILVNCSDKDNLYKGFLKNRPLEKILEHPDFFMGIAESTGNPDRYIHIDDVAPHYWFYQDGASHRFSSTEMINGFVIGRREIANYTTYAGEFSPIPIEELAADTIYLSFMYSEYDDDYNVIELQKEGLKITFRQEF